jgi:glycosyltransferase involved in cell wall biosynthesis
MLGRLLMIIPPVTRRVGGILEVESDCVNNLQTYLKNFEHVTFACPLSLSGKSGNILRSIPLNQIASSDRLAYVELPYAYREDRYATHFFATRNMLRKQIDAADVLIFSPHAKFDWVQLAISLARKASRKYVIESDWDHESVQRQALTRLPRSVRKLRKSFWHRSFLNDFERGLRSANLALLQGDDVYDAYRHFSKLAFKVLNVQVDETDQITREDLSDKLSRVAQRSPIRISYAGRAIDMKGPLEWLRAIRSAVELGAEIEATWFGAGDMISEMQTEILSLGLAKCVTLAGTVDRMRVLDALRHTDIFLFCHKTKESPRCIGEALAAGCALVGFDSAYARGLVEEKGGGRFRKVNDWPALGELIASLDIRRSELADLIQAAAQSGRLLDRDIAMQHRVDLIREHVCAAT